MTEPKTQTERAKAFLEYKCKVNNLPASSQWHPRVDVLLQWLEDHATSEVEAAIRDLREQLEAAEAVIRHYADESFWDEPHPDLGYVGGTVIYNFEDEIDGAISGYRVAQEYLKKHGGE